MTSRQVFISYVREDAAEVDRLQQLLEAADIRVWRDTGSLRPGEDWRIKIRQAIADESLVFIACFSDRSESREKAYQREELLLAIEQVRQRQVGETWLIPVRFSDCTLPQYDLGANRTLASFTWVDLFGDRWDEGIVRLAMTVRQVLSVAGRERQAQPALDRATAGWKDRLLDVPLHAITHRTGGRAHWPISVPRRQLRLIRGHTSWINSVCALPVRERTLLASTSFGSVRLWDPTTGRLEVELLAEGHGIVTCSCLVVVDARVLLVTGGCHHDHWVQLWDPATGDAVGDPLRGHADTVGAVCAVPVGDQMLLASAGGMADQTVQLWDPASGKPIGDPLTDHTAQVTSLCALPLNDRMLFASGSHDGTVRLWEPVTGQPRGAPLAVPRLNDDHNNAVYDMCVVPVDGRMLLAAAYGDGVVRLWDPATGQLHGEPLRGHAGVVGAVCVVPVGDRMLLASAGHAGTVRLWDPANGEAVGAPLAGHTAWVSSLCSVAVDGQMLLVSASYDGTIRLWGTAEPTVAPTPPGLASPSRPRNNPVELPLQMIERGTAAGAQWPNRAPTQEVRSLRGHTNTLQSVCGVMAGQEVLVASSSIDGTVRLWDPGTGQPRGEPLTGHTGTVSSVCALPGERRMLLASGSIDGTVRLWDPTRATSVGEPLETGAVFAMCVVPLKEHTLLAIGDVDGVIRLWDPIRREMVGGALTGHADWISSLCVIPVSGQTILATGSRDKTVRLWDPMTGRAHGAPLRRGRFGKGHTDWVHAVCAVPVGDWTLLASAGADKAIWLWDPATGQAVAGPLMSHTDSVLALCALPLGQGTLLASAGWDATVRLWDPATGQPVGEPLFGHSDAVNDICVVPVDGQMFLATSSHDSSVRLWGSGNGRKSFNAILDESAEVREGTESMFDRRMRAALRQVDGRAYLRGDIIPWLVAYGRFKIDDEHSGIDRDEIWPTVAAIHKIWRGKAQEFVDRLADVASPVGGWAVYGAHRLVSEILGSEYCERTGRLNSRYREMFKSAMGYIFDQGYNSWRMSNYELDLLAEIRRDADDQ